MRRPVKQNQTVYIHNSENLFIKDELLVNYRHVV